MIKGFFKWVLLRVFLIALTCLGFVHAFYQLGEEYYFTFIGLGILLLLQVYFLVVYLNRLNHKLSQLFQSLKEEDFSFGMQKSQKDILSEDFFQSLNSIREALQEHKVQNVKKDIYLENIVNHVDTGLLLIAEQGNIKLINPAAKSLLKVEKLNHIKDLSNISQALFDLVSGIEPLKPRDIKIIIHNDISHLLFKGSVFKLEEKIYKIVTFQNIADELELNELNSWQKLIKVFTHEIMNSVTPIVSLAASLRKQFKNEIDPQNKMLTLNKEIAVRTLNGLETVEETSGGLLEFVSKYRDLTALPQPHISKTKISEFFQKIQLLMEKDIANNEVNFKILISPVELSINMDKSQIEIAIINLLKNSLNALKGVENKSIELRAYVDSLDRTIIEVFDNGSGIKPEYLEDIFIPFFSTKDGGTGIGLALCRQIMRIHSGKIKVESKPQSGTTFRLIF